MQRVADTSRNGRLAQSLRAHQRVEIAILCLFAVFCILSLASCKYSDALTEHIEDPVNGVLDETQDPDYRDVPGAPEDPTRTSSQLSDNDNLAEQANTLPDYDQNTPDDEQTDQRDQEDDSAHTQNATSGSEQGDQDRSSTNPTEQGDEGTSAGDEGTGGSSAGSSAQGNESSDEADLSRGGDDGIGNGSGAGTGGTAQIYDSTGTNEDVPTSVDGIAAAGQYATIVQMLAGKGGLVAADSDWIATVQAEGAFPDEGVENLTAAWSGDGSSGSQLDVDALIAVHPEAVLVDGHESVVSDADQETLVANGISVVVVPTLGTTDVSDADIEEAVRIVGEMLDGSTTQYQSAQAASQYIQMHDSTVNAVLSANGGYSFKMVQGTSYQFIYQGNSSTGASTTSLSNVRTTTAYIDSLTSATQASATAVRHFGDIAMYLDGESMDTSDGVGLSAYSASGSFILLDYYLQIAGVVNNAYDVAKPAADSTGVERPYAVIPGDSQSFLSDVQQRAVPSALWYSITGSSADPWQLVGNAAYPGIIVRDESIASSVAASAAKTNGLYNVGQSYNIYVMPSGLAGNWADGTVESYLAIPWAYAMFHSGGDTSAASTYVNSFYSTFYRCAPASVVNDYQTVYTATCPTS